ncbi:MAG: M56 family metallopeptidase [Chitinophagaceae bacterium]
MYWLQNIGPALLASLWQSAIAYTVLFAFRRSQLTSPDKSYLLGIALQYVLMGLFLCNIFSNGSASSNIMPQISYPIKNIFSNNYISYTYIILLLLNTFVFIYKSVHSNREIRLQSTHTTEIPNLLYKLTETWKTKLGIRRPIRLVIQQSVVTPFTKGFLKPVILLPLSALNGLESKQMEAVLLHELWHIKRHDYLFLLLQLCLEKIMYFNPFYLLIGKAIHEDRELSCDTKSIKTSNLNSIDYIESLLYFSKKGNGLVPSSGTLSLTGKPNSELVNRAAFLLENRKNRTFQASFGMNILAVGALVLSILSTGKLPQADLLEKAGNMSAPSNANYTMTTSPELEKTVPPINIANNPVKEKIETKSIVNKEVTTSNRKKSNTKTKQKKLQTLAVPATLDANTTDDETARNNQSTFARLANYIQPSDLNEYIHFKPLRINANKAVFVAGVSNQDDLEQLFIQVANNINKHFNIESSSFQYSAFIDNNQLIEQNTIELKSTDYRFILVKTTEKIYLAITPRKPNV